MEEKNTWHSSRRLVMRGLKPSDYFLYKEQKEFFNFDMRQLFVLGLRERYAQAHDPLQIERMLSMAHLIYSEDLDTEVDRPQYHSFASLMRSSPLRGPSV